MRLFLIVLCSGVVIGCGGDAANQKTADLAPSIDLSSPSADLAPAEDAQILDASPDGESADASIDMALVPDLRATGDAGLCTTVVCGPQMACCPCTGMCYAEACLACCMFCH
jgi:hypothetical protein